MARPTRSGPFSTPGYLGRRSATELAVLDALAVAAGLAVVLPGVVRLETAWVLGLVALSPGLLLLARSLVTTLGVPGAWTRHDLDPRLVPVAHPRLVAARRMTGWGTGALAVTAVALVATV